MKDRKSHINVLGITNEDNRKEGGKEKTQNEKLGLSKRRRKGENSTINEMNVRGKIVNVLVQVNRKSIVKTLSMGLICELDLVQAKGKRGERENETETRYCEDCTCNGDRETKREAAMMKRSMKRYTM